MRAGRLMLVGSIISRLSVVALLCALALMTSYVNLKQAYNNPRLVELSLGATARKAYEVADAVLGQLGDPMEVAQSNGGMTWSIRILGMPFTDPVAALSVLAVGAWLCSWPDRATIVGVRIRTRVLFVHLPGLALVFCGGSCAAVAWSLVLLPRVASRSRVGLGNSTWWFGRGSDCRTRSVGASIAILCAWANDFSRLGNGNVVCRLG